MISSILPGNDKFNGKGDEVKDFLSSLCDVNNFYFIKHRNILGDI